MMFYSLSNKICNRGIFKFKNLNRDFQLFTNLIFEKNPNLIVGFGNSRNTLIERFAINRFNQKIINKNGKEKYKLFVPHINLNLSVSPTDSFCNWTAYK